MIGHLNQRMASQDQLGEICCILIRAMPSLTHDQARVAIRERSILEKEIRKIFMTQESSSVVADNGHKNTKIDYWKTLIVEELDKLETFFPAALEIAKNRQPGHENIMVRQEDLAEVLNCSHPTIGKIFRDQDSWKGISGSDRLRLIKEELSKEFPERWPNLCGKASRFTKYFRQ